MDDGVRELDVDAGVGADGLEEVRAVEVGDGRLGKPRRRGSATLRLKPVIMSALVRVTAPKRRQWMQMVVAKGMWL